MGQADFFCVLLWALTLKLFIQKALLKEMITRVPVVAQ